MAEKEGYLPPPPGLGFDEPVKKDETKVDIPMAGVVKPKKHHIPDNMALYERNPYIQIFLVSVTAAVAISNIVINFRMIPLHEQQEAELRALIATPRLPLANQTAAINEFVTRFDNGEEYLCDFLHFNSSSFSEDEFLSTLGTITAISKASTYLALILFVPMHLIFKAISAFYMIRNDYSGAITERTNAAAETTSIMLHSMGAKDTAQAPVSKPKPVVMTRAAANSMILENEDEKNVRIFLRGETILFAWVQGFQDIPQATLAVVYIIIQRGVRGLVCYRAFIEGTVVPNPSYDQIDTLPYIQLGLVALSAAWNILILGARWLRFFHHRTVKMERKPRPIGFRIAEGTLWFLIYIFGICTPVFAWTWSGLGRDIVGYGEDSVGIFYTLTIVGAVCAAIGFLVICCWWGTNFSEGICVGCVVWEAFCVACGACQFEFCEFCHLCSPC